jgi:hypothetical protein
LDGDQPADPIAEHKNRPDPQSTTGSEENHAKPASGIAVDSPNLLPVRVGRQGLQGPSGCRDPRAHRAQISAGEERYTSQSCEPDCERYQRRVGEEWRKPAPAEYGQAEIGSCANRDQRHSNHGYYQLVARFGNDLSAWSRCSLQRDRGVFHNDMNRRHGRRPVLRQKSISIDGRTMPAGACRPF